jgi:pimeloyl-ACP methyl ester carboxylesterase
MSLMTALCPLCDVSDQKLEDMTRPARPLLAAGDAGGFVGFYQCIKVFSETDLTEDLKQFDVPTLIIHGDDDQIVPIGASALLSSKIVKESTLKIYPGAPHGLASTHKDQVNADLLAFIKERSVSPSRQAVPV